MRNLQASIMKLQSLEFTKPSQANSFFPANNSTDHIHLGVPTSFMDNGTQKFAEGGDVFVTYISFKKNNQTFFRMVHNDSDGYFSFPAGKSAADLPVAWQTALRGLGIVRGLGA